jgi:hypothetical protein
VAWGGGRYLVVELRLGLEEAGFLGREGWTSNVDYRREAEQRSSIVISLPSVGSMTDSGNRVYQPMQ